MYEDIVTLLQPTVLALRVCGICPSSLRRYSIPNSNKIYGLFLTFVILMTGYVFFTGLNEFRNIIHFMVTVSIIGQLLRSWVLILSAFTTTEPLLKFIRIMESAQRSLCTLNIQQHPCPSKISQVVWLAVFFVPKVLSALGLGFSGRYLIALSLLIHAFVVTGTACKVRVLLTLVRGKFELLNWHLDDLNNRWPVFLPRPADVSFREFSCVREWRRTKFIQENEDTRSVTAEKIKNFNKAHLKLFYAFKILNSICSLSNLFLIVPGIINISIGIPLNLSFSPNSQSTLKPNLAVYFEYFGEIMSLVVVLSEASKIQEEIDKTALLVHDLLDENCHSPDVLKELEEFSMALLHRRTTFTASGFFDVNLKLVARAGGLLAPIILFLTQRNSQSNKTI